MSSFNKHLNNSETGYNFKAIVKVLYCYSSYCVKFACLFTYKECYLAYLLCSLAWIKLVLVLFDNDKEENEGEECDMCVHYHYHNCHGAKEHLLM